jgi:hypothetical protein
MMTHFFSNLPKFEPEFENSQETYVTYLSLARLKRLISAVVRE